MDPVQERGIATEGAMGRKVGAVPDDKKAFEFLWQWPEN